MRTALAEKLLVKIMGWSSNQISEERPLIQALSSFKYNEYQQFSIGTRFVESLVKWLNQFETKEEKDIAYNFIKNRLIFISNDQMLHLVNITFSDKINPFLIRKSAGVLNINPFLVRKIISSDQYKTITRRSLFIGLSDGSRIDQLRRYSGLNNEQVIPTYQIGKEKVEDMKAELKKSNVTDSYNTVFLIDDFTASGTSYFRQESSERKGKIFNVINSALHNQDAELYGLIDHTEIVDINIIFYIATEESVNKLRNEINTWKEEFNSNFNFTIEVVQKIEGGSKISVEEDKEFVELSKKYIDKSIIDVHFKKAKYENYFLGYNECALPLILVHNTPNNSMPLLWWVSSDKKFIGLFPRVTRHK